MVRFGKDIEAGDMVVYNALYTATMGIHLEAWDWEGPYAKITLCVPEIDLRHNEVILNHDILFDKEFVDAFREHFCDKSKGERLVNYGRFGHSFTVTLKDNWEDLCIPRK